MTDRNNSSAESAEAMLKRVPFNDDADEPKTWRGLAHSILLDMFRYAKDPSPERRLVSAEAYVEDALRLASIPDATSEIERLRGQVKLSDNLLDGLTGVVQGLKAELAEHTGDAGQPTVVTDETVARAMYDWQYGQGAWDSSRSAQRDHYVGLARAALAAQPPAAPVETVKSSSGCVFCDIGVQLAKGESITCTLGDVSSSSAGTEPAGWLVDRPGDPTFPRFYHTEAEAKAMEAFITVSPRGNVRPVFTNPPQGVVTVDNSLAATTPAPPLSRPKLCGGSDV